MDTTLSKHMDAFSKDDLRGLLEPASGPCVSLFMPTMRAAAETQQNAIRFKNLLRQAEEELAQQGMRPTEAHQLLAPAHALLDDNEFWTHQSDGLALFRTPELFQTYRLPLNLSEQVVVSDRLSVKPLVPLLSGDGHFYVLALSQGHLRLLRGTQHTIDEVALPADVPTSLEESLKYTDLERDHQFRQNTSGSRAVGSSLGAMGASFHGQGDNLTDDLVYVRQYIQRVSSGLHQILANERSPLVLAGVEYMPPLFRSTSPYQHIADAVISHSPDNMSVEELHSQAWSIVQPIFAQERQNALALYHQLADGERTSPHLTEIVPAAVYGRVDQLFIAEAQARWGRFDHSSSRAELHEQRQPGDTDLLDMATLHTLLNGGTVYVLDPSQLPSPAGAAAVFRY